MLVDVDTGHPAPSCIRQVDRGPARAAPHFEDLAIDSDAELIREVEPFARGEPAALTQILAVRLEAYGKLGLAGEVGVNVVVQVDGAGGHGSSRGRGRGVETRESRL